MRVMCECSYAETSWFRSVWQSISEYFYFSRILELPPPSTFTSLSVVIFASSISFVIPFWLMEKGSAGKGMGREK